MFTILKKRVDKELSRFIKEINSSYNLNKISPIFYKSVKDFVLREGKRIRPILFIIGYLGFAKKQAKNLYKSALSVELLHDFLLIHDDIIDKSDLRRNKPSMHKSFNNYLKKHKDIKFKGEDLAIVVADAINAFAVDALLSIKESPKRKEEALKIFLKAAVYTELGEFIELLEEIKEIKNTTEEAVYKIYDYKTAYYTFALPLAMGATLAGAGKKDIELLKRYGLTIGRAFQIKDDILGIFGNEKKTGKSSSGDLEEAKRTILIYQAYKKSNKKEKAIMASIFSKKIVTKSDLLKMRKLIIASGSLAYAQRQVVLLEEKAEAILTASYIYTRHKNALTRYSHKLLNLKNTGCIYESKRS